jgi:hypothetical protein
LRANISATAPHPSVAARLASYYVEVLFFSSFFFYFCKGFSRWSS